jgi:hypothetical protein
MLFTACGPQSQGPAALTPEAKAYTKHLALSGVELKATEAFSGQAVVEILGKITNNGERPVKSVEVTCIFYDPYNQVVLRERLAIVREKSGGLKSGETKPFRLPFDNLPSTWNQSLPQLVIASVLFG